MTPEQRARLSAARMGYRPGPEHRAKMRLAQTGRRHGPETIRKMSIAQTGHPVREDTRAKLRLANLGHRYGEETKEKLRRIQKKRYENPEEREKMGLIVRKRYENPEYREKFTGPNSFAWRGGIHVPYGPTFNHDLREIVRKRDDYLCQNPTCYVPENGQRHSVHHIDYNKTHDDPKNLISLCRSCHQKTTIGNHDYRTEYYQSIQEMRGITNGRTTQNHNL